MNENIKFETIKKAADIKFKLRNLGSVEKIFSNSPPSVFIGSKLIYPAVNVGILSPLERDENVWMYEAEKYWADNNFQIGDILRLRDSVLNSRFQTTVKQARTVNTNSGSQNKFLNLAKEIALASKPVDIEIELIRGLNLKRQPDKITLSHGMNAPLKKAKITSNVSIPQKIEKVVNDDIKASEGISYLYQNGFDEYALNKILSIGVLGLKKNKRLVPTRWSITATDDTLGKNLINEIKEYRWLENYELFVGGFMGNYYLILFFPGVWSYELFELYLPGSSWNPSNEIKASTDFETYNGRKTYASNTAGGYYAARLPILQYLEKIKRQASVLAIRLETPSYWAALGVWVVRESVRKTLVTNRIQFNDINELTNSVNQISKNRFKFSSEEILKKSKLLEQIKTQRNLLKWV